MNSLSLDTPIIIGEHVCFKNQYVDAKKDVYILESIINDMDNVEIPLLFMFDVLSKCYFKTRHAIIKKKILYAYFKYNTLTRKGLLTVSNRYILNNEFRYKFNTEEHLSFSSTEVNSMIMTNQKTCGGDFSDNENDDNKEESALPMNCSNFYEILDMSLIIKNNRPCLQRCVIDRDDILSKFELFIISFISYSYMLMKIILPLLFIRFIFRFYLGHTWVLAVVNRVIDLCNHLLIMHYS